MLQINIDVKKVFYFALGFAVLYAIVKYSQNQDAKLDTVKKSLAEKQDVIALSANLDSQIDAVEFTQWQQLNFATAGGGANVSLVPYAKTFTNTTSVSIPATEHLKANVSSILVMNANGDAISHGFNLTGQDVTVTFIANETGTVLVS